MLKSSLRVKKNTKLIGKFFSSIEAVIGVISTDAFLAKAFGLATFFQFSLKIFRNITEFGA